MCANERDGGETVRQRGVEVAKVSELNTWDQPYKGMESVVEKERRESRLEGVGGEG